MLEFFINEGGESCKLMFDIQNDFAYTVKESVIEKIRFLEEIIQKTEGERAKVQKKQDFIVKL